MSIFSSMSNAISRTFDTVASAADTAEETIGMATNHIHNRAKAHAIRDKQYVVTELAKDLNRMSQDLEDDANLKTLYEDLIKDW